MKTQETLEEVIGREFQFHSSTEIKDEKYVYLIDKRGFIKAVNNILKWQQEKDKNKYSEEDMNEYADYVLMCSAEKTFKLPLPPKEWFNKFKNK